MLDHRDARGGERSVGKPNPMTEVKILDPAGRPVAAGEVGEIYLRSPGVSIGYWQRPEATADTFAGGWCRIGDLGTVDADGFLTLAGRTKHMIRSASSTPRSATRPAGERMTLPLWCAKCTLLSHGRILQPDLGPESPG
jgi:fatty-acyl-CoA synthase